MNLVKTRLYAKEIQEFNLPVEIIRGQVAPSFRKRPGLGIDATNLIQGPFHYLDHTTQTRVDADYLDDIAYATVAPYSYPTDADKGVFCDFYLRVLNISIDTDYTVASCGLNSIDSLPNVRDWYDRFEYSHRVVPGNWH